MQEKYVSMIEYYVILNIIPVWMTKKSLKMYPIVNNLIIFRQLQTIIIHHILLPIYE